MTVLMQWRGGLGGSGSRGLLSAKGSKQSHSGTLVSGQA